jgi:hypothetical protein
MITALPAGFAPDSFHFYDEKLAAPDAMGDSVAKIVMARFRDAVQSKSNTIVYQGKSVIRLLRESRYAMEKRYTPEMNDAMTAAFGVCPSRYYGLSSAKSVAISNWKTELISDPGALVNIVPTPNPRLPKSSIIKIKEEVKDELIKRMIEAGVGDPSMLIQVGSNRLHDSVKSFLDEKAQLLRQLEQAKITTSAMQAAKRIQILMRDTVIEGNFREAYSDFSYNQVADGWSVMRFPHWKRQVVLADSQDFKGKPERMWKTVPTFEAVNGFNFFVVNDGRSVEDVTARMQYRSVSKTTLVGLTKDKRYDEQAILDIMDNYSMRSRNWLFPEGGDTVGESGNPSTYWGPEELVAVIYHEGWLTGRDLHEYGLTGYEDSTVYSAGVEVCCGRTIRVEVVDPTKAMPCSYAATKYESLGDGVYNAVGVPHILQNTQDRVNTMYAIWEANLDWSLRPPLQVNSEALKNPGDAMRIVPGGKFEVSDLVGAGSMPDPIRAIRGPSAQYQIVYPLIQQIIRQADQEVGVPDLADMSTFGRGSLGELSARVSQAVRRIRAAAFAEDRAMKTIWQVLFEWVAEENPEVLEGADLTMDYIGIVGLLQKEAEKKAKMERLSLIMQASQAGVAPPEVVKFGFHDLLTDAGVPTDALGMEDPLINNAIAVALQGGPIGATPSLAGPPALDGRSAPMQNIPTAIAAPNGGVAPPPVGM